MDPKIDLDHDEECKSQSKPTSKDELQLHDILWVVKEHPIAMILNDSTSLLVWRDRASRLATDQVVMRSSPTTDKYVRDDCWLKGNAAY